MYTFISNLIKKDSLPLLGTTIKELGRNNGTVSGHNEYGLYKRPTVSTGGSFMLVMILENAVQIYLDWKRTHTTSATSRYEVRLRQFVNYLGADKPLIEITGDDVIYFHNHLSRSVFNKRGKGDAKYSLATIAYSARVLRNFFAFWQGRGKCMVSPKEILTIRYSNPIKKIVDLKEFEKMSDSLDERFADQLLKKLMIHLLWDTGMRISELRDLNISDINARHIEHGVRTAQIRTRKTMKYNLIVWSNKTDKLLDRLLDLRKSMPCESDALFINMRRGKEERITVRTFERWISSIAKDCGLSSAITPHSFRHGKGHHILNQSGNVRDIHVILRHTRPESSFHYLNLNQEQFLATAVKYLVAA